LCGTKLLYFFRLKSPLRGTKLLYAFWLKASDGPSIENKSNNLVPLCGESSICREETFDIRSLAPRPRFAGPINFMPPV
jgi:hypothetical protein